MEMMAVIEGLKALKNSSAVTIHTDSRYVMDGASKWILGWKKKGWKTADKKPVKNEDLWRALDDEMARHQIHWRWVAAIPVIRKMSGPMRWRARCHAPTAQHEEFLTLSPSR